MANVANAANVANVPNVPYERYTKVSRATKLMTTDSKSLAWFSVQWRDSYEISACNQHG